ncbi:hypothetical protein QYF36_002586 [Acer negundo]|nr:hypothetical protein QYF36_002586 [Acer negundo]
MATSGENTDIPEAKYPRSYYRCAYRRSKGCLGTKTVQRSNEDPTMFEETSPHCRSFDLCFRVAQASEMTDKSPSLFGMVMMANNPLTETLDPKSKPVACAQGLYGSASQAELGLIMVFDFDFTEGGTGILWLARGYAIAQTHWFDPASVDAIVGYNVATVH